MFNRFILAMLILIPMVISCHQGSSENADNLPEGQGVPLILGADGSLYSGDCLRTHGFGNVAGCKYDSAAQASRAYHNYGSPGYGGYNYGGSYYDYGYPYSYYYVLDPTYYDQNSFWSYFGCPGGCGGYGSYFGYGADYNYGSSYRSDCGSYCYGSLQPGRCQKSCWRNSWYY